MAAASAVFFAALIPLAAQQPSFRVDVRLVRVLTTVKDAHGQLIGSLTRDDFQIFDNGVPQQLRVFEHHTEQPLSITVMMPRRWSPSIGRPFCSPTSRTTWTASSAACGASGERVARAFTTRSIWPPAGWRGAKDATS